VHMYWLRSKLRETGSGHGMIRTVYGSGYIFEAGP
jgi:DNA-binding winged helix-turn-helix (wHTH) protein